MVWRSTSLSAETRSSRTTPTPFAGGRAKRSADFFDTTRNRPADENENENENRFLRQDFVNHVSFHIRQAAFNSVMHKCQSLVIESQQMQDRRVEIV